MSDKNKDVDLDKSEDLYEELRNTLKESEVEETPVASDQKPKGDIDTPKAPIDEDENVELSEEEISKLSPRAQKRIRDLATQVKELAEKPAEKSPADSPKEDVPETTHNFKDVKEFLDAVEDESSRKLLEKFYGVIKGEISQTLSPIETANNKAKFEIEFAQYEKIDGIADYKNDLQKTFLRDPSKSIKTLVSEVMMDIQLNKVKPIETIAPDPKHDGKIDLDGLSKDELYDTMASLKG